MRPDLLQAKYDRERNALEIEMTDFTHRVNAINHTLKAIVYEARMKEEFPGAEITAREYRSPEFNVRVPQAREFREELQLALDLREAELKRRRG
jgi:hypothetical protein